MTELYRRISIRMWGDQDFRRLSGPEPNAKDLWVYLLTGLHTNPIPGLFPAYQEQLARQLNWPLEGFRKALSELIPEGTDEDRGEASTKRWLEADWDAGVVWISNSFWHNEPQSPNVIKGWKKFWPLIPECPLKTKAFHELRALCYEKGKAFGAAFDKTFEKPKRKPSRKPSAITGAGAGAGAGAVNPEARERAGVEVEQGQSDVSRAAAAAPLPQPSGAPPLPSGSGAAWSEVELGFSSVYQPGKMPVLFGTKRDAAVEHCRGLAARYQKPLYEVAQAVCTAAGPGSRSWDFDVSKVDPYAPAPLVNSNRRRNSDEAFTPPAPAELFSAKEQDSDDLFGPRRKPREAAHG
jgi:hypothetical protein